MGLLAKDTVQGQPACNRVTLPLEEEAALLAEVTGYQFSVAWLVSPLGKMVPNWLGISLLWSFGHKAHPVLMRKVHVIGPQNKNFRNQKTSVFKKHIKKTTDSSCLFDSCHR